ncbi:MAG: hypothetical protein LC808_20630, partial [Actinobacteria bacterium]|nr:hypothetical protein [Actinomycetota bacterium]
MSQTIKKAQYRPAGITHQPDRSQRPTGSPNTYVLANLFMHYAFDRWMAREHPGVPFERYADDGVV